MKPLFILFTSLIMLACGPTKFTPNKNMKFIDFNTTQIELKVGQEAYYQAMIHGSVGIQVEIFIDNEETLKITKQQINYDNPDHAKMAGGDRASKIFVIEALKEGTAKIIIRNVFRGELKKEKEVTCIITN